MYFSLVIKKFRFYFITHNTRLAFCPLILTASVWASFQLLISSISYKMINRSIIKLFIYVYSLFQEIYMTSVNERQYDTDI